MTSDTRAVTEEGLQNPDFPISVSLMAVQAIRSFGRFPDTDSPTVERSGSVDGWDYTIWIGPIPTMLYALLGLREDPVDPEWTNNTKLYVTFKVIRKQTWPLGQIPSSFTHVPPIALPLNLQKHLTDAERVMSVLVAQLELVEGFTSDKVRTRAPLYVVLPDGWRPVSKMHISARSEEVHDSWSVVDQLTTATLGDEMPKNVRNALGPATRWLLRARNEDDDLKSFIFGYVGLEAFVSAMYAELQQTVVTALSTASASDRTGGQPLDEAVIRQLLWPHDQDKGNPYRSFRFRFAIVAAALSPRTAGSDDAMVAKLSSLRNKIHGGDLQVEWTDASDVTQLLRRYVTLAGQHFAT